MSEIGLMLAARYPLLYLVSPEEETAEEELVAIAQSRKSPIYFWDMSRGWDDKPGADKGNVMSALTRVGKAPNNQPAVFVLKDLATLIAPGNNGQITAGQLPIVREIKNLAREMARDRRCLVLLSDQLRLPLELREETTVVDLSLPTIDEISGQVDKLVGQKLKVSPDGREQLLKACQGLTRCRIARVLAKCLARSGKVDQGLRKHAICSVLRKSGRLINLRERSP